MVLKICHTLESSKSFQKILTSRPQLRPVKSKPLRMALKQKYSDDLTEEACPFQHISTVSAIYLCVNWQSDSKIYVEKHRWQNSQSNF